ncbi:efflux RND transporter permease subunit [Clostridium drakei]|uniref:Acriflavin resistance protein n=1 Tax=Clostridium drakei TaxID=332101 RepID=A0A2U8DL65_9CLOT|nr:efflux RND transporter permease subunit [Clostridium drakei]AWI03215.1 acriflavin resistance protein [Clostridium drakei]
MFIANLSIKRPVFITVIMIAMLAVGIVCYTGLPVNNMPDVDAPYASVQITENGAAPDQMESKITKKIEDAVAQISGVKHITSTITDGNSNTTIEFSLETDANQALQNVKDKIDSIKGQLPQDIDTPVVSKMDISASPIVSLVLTSDDKSNGELSQIVDDSISKKLSAIKGVGSVKVNGKQDREIHIKLDKNKLAAYNIAPSEVTQSLGNDNINASSGKVSSEDKEITLKTNSTIKNVDDFNNVLVAKRNGVEIRVRDIATVEDGLKAKDSLTYYNGKEAIGIDVVKQSGTNTVQVAEDIKKGISSIQQSLPKGVKLQIVTDNSTDIKDSVNDVKRTIIEGCVLAILIIFMFLKEWSSTSISAISLPVSIITTFIGLKLMNFSLNTMSLMGLSLSVGLLIDDAIVVIENISRHLNMGKSPIQAAKDGTAEIGLAVMATTFAVAAVFTPIAMVSGMIGKFFKQFGLTVAIAVLISLFISFTLVPMLSSKYLRHEKDKKIPLIGGFLDWFNNWFDSLSNIYAKILRVSLRHRKLTIIIPIMMFFASLLLATQLNTSFITASDDGNITVEASLDSGGTLNNASNTTKNMEAIIKKNSSNIKYVYSTVKSGSINISVKLIDQKKRKESTKEIANKIHDDLSKMSGIQLAVNTSTGMGSGKSITFHLQGQDFNQLYEYALKAEKALKNTKGAIDVSLSYKAGQPQVKLEVDRDKAADLGVDANSISRTLNILFNGSTVTKFETDKDRYDVVAKLQDDQRKDFDSLQGIYVSNSEGKMIPIDQVTKKVFTTASSTINRYDKAREIKLTANNTSDVTSGTINMEFNKKLENDLKPPSGVTTGAGGDQADMVDSFKSLATALGMGILFIFLVLSAQFESFIDPLAILFSLPLAIIGAILGLFIGNKDLNIMSAIGIIMLMGLVTKNAILLIDFAKQKRAEGIERSESIIQAGHTRLRPILMTTLAMIFGMIPTAIGSGSSASTRSPMAYAIIGGLITSTLLTLFVVPCIYTILDDMKGFSRKKNLNKLSKTEMHRNN